MWVSQGGLPIGLTIGGYHHGTTEKAGNRHRARRREVVAPGVRRDARRGGAREQTRSQQGKRPRLAFRRVPRRAGRRRPGPQHRRARALPRAGGGASSAYLLAKAAHITDLLDDNTESDGRWGGHYTRCRSHCMPQGKALKAVARKKLKVIRKVMRGKAPYLT